MSENKHRLSIVIGAALSGGFNAAVSGGTSKLTRFGGVVKDIEKQSIASGAALEKLKLRYDSLSNAMNRQQAIVAKRNFYKSQILEVVALGAALAAPIKSAMDFENALADIRAVVDFKAPDDLQKLGDTFAKLSREIPTAADELANIAAIGGRFGVQASELAEFSKEVAKTAVAWRAPVAETAERVGNLMKVFNASINQLPQYFNAINHLGNKTGATADNILQAINRSADGLANFKLSIPQVAALTSTIMSFGEGAEQAGSAVGNMLQKLSIAPQLGATAQKALRSMGLSSVTLPKIIMKEPQKVLDKLFTGLSRLNPEKRSSALYAIFGRGAAKTVGKLVDNLELYRKNLALVSNQKLYEGSRNGDYQIVFETAQAQLKILGNTFTAFMRVVGNSLLPALKKIVSGINNVLSPVIKWMENNRELTQTITTAAAGLVGFRIATFALGYASTFLFGGLNRLNIGFKGLQLGISLVGAVLRNILLSSFWKLGLVLSAIGLLTTVLKKDLGAELVARLRHCSIRLLSLFEIIKKKTELTIKKLSISLSPLTKEIERALPPNFVKGLKNIQKIITKIGELLKTAFSPASKKLSEVKTEAQKFPGIFANFGKELRMNNAEILKNTKTLGLWSGAIFLGSKLLKSVLTVAFFGFGKILSFVAGGVGLFGRVLLNIASVGIPLAFTVTKLLFQTFWFFSTEVIPTMVRGLFFVGSCFKTLAFQWIPATVSGFRSLAGAILRLAAGAISPIIPYITRLTTALKALYMTSVQKLLKTFPLLGTVMKGFLITSGILILAGIAYTIYKNWDALKVFFAKIWDGIVEKWTAFTNKASTLGKVVGLISGLFKQAFIFTLQLGKAVLTIGENVTALISKFIFGKDTVIPVWKSIKSFFADFWSTPSAKLEEWLNKIADKGVVDKIKSVWSSLKTFFTNLWAQIAPNFSELTKPLSDIWHKIKDVFPVGTLKTATTPALKLPNIRDLTPNTARNQNNNFAITINAAKNDDSESIANKVMNRVQNYSKTFLFDEVAV